MPASKFTRSLGGDGAHPDTFWILIWGVSGWLIVLGCLLAVLGGLRCDFRELPHQVLAYVIMV